MNLRFNPKGVLAFNSINTFVNGKVGGPEDKEAALPYVGKKIYGTDIGQLVTAETENATYMIKTGVSISLLFQSVEHYVDNQKAKAKIQKIQEDLRNITDQATIAKLEEELKKQQEKDKDSAKKERMKLKFVVEEFTKISGEKDNNDVFLNDLCKAMTDFRDTAAGKVILEKISKDKFKSADLNTNDVNGIYFYLTGGYATLRDVVGLPAMADVIKGAYGQLVNNHFQQRKISKDQLDEHRLFIVNDNNKTGIYLGSRMIPNAKAFHEVLLNAFRGNSNGIQNFANKEEWLKHCKNVLTTDPDLENLAGLASAILIRHLMGESADLGPDNMLLVSDQNKTNVVNIDITGFRFPRRNLFAARKSLGWELTLSETDTDELLKRLLDKTVFNGRFAEKSKLWDADTTTAVMDVVREVMTAKLKANVQAEVQDVRDWLKGLPFDLISQNLQKATEEVYSHLTVEHRPDVKYRDALVKHNQIFLNDYKDVVQKMSLEEKSELTPQ